MGWRVAFRRATKGCVVLGGVVVVVGGLGCGASLRADFDVAARLRFEGAAGGPEIAWAEGDDWRKASIESWALGGLGSGSVAMAHPR